MTSSAGFAARALRFPRVFELEPVGLEFLSAAKRKMVFTTECDGDPAFLFDAFTQMREGRSWMGGFLAMERQGDSFDESFTFMRLRGRTLVAERPARWVARIEAASLPLATRMIEDVEITQEGGRTRVMWTFYFDPHPLALPFEWIVTRMFSALFARSLTRLGRLAESAR